MKKRILSLFLAISLLLPGMLTVPVSAAATSGSCGNTLTWSFNSTTGTLTISGTGTMTDYSDPSVVPWYTYRYQIKTLNLSEGLTSIGSYAFAYESSLTGVTIPSTVTRIGTCAFYYCSKLASAPLPAGLTSIGNSAFFDCALTTVDIPVGVTEILNSTFADNDITTLTIPGTVKTIGDSAFANCTALTDVTIQEGVTTVKNYAFDGCAALENLSVPASVTSLGYITDEPMNTRIQVEHPVTEQRTGIDIVEEQIRIARGKVMGYTQDSIVANGHAIECRIYAEDPENNFMPAPAQLTLYHEPKMRGVRIDSSINSPTVISDSYDPMISKLISHGKTRESAIEITRNALKEYIVQTYKTNIPYLQSIIANEDFINNKIDTSYCEKHQQQLIESMHVMRNEIKKEDVVALFLFYDFNKSYLENKDINNVWERIGYWRYNMNITVSVEGQQTTDNRQQSMTYDVNIKKISPKSLSCNINGQDYEVLLTQNGGDTNKVMINGMTESIFVSETSDNNYCVHLRGLDFICRRNDELNDSRDYSCNDVKNSDMTYYSPMPGKVIKVNVKEGDEVKEGDVLCVVEAMKMENNIKAMTSAKVAKVFVNEGDKVDVKNILIELSI